MSKDIGNLEFIDEMRVEQILSIQNETIKIESGNINVKLFHIIDKYKSESEEK